jgi:diguanylate cyclase (GGDEF)-like protein
MDLRLRGLLHGGIILLVMIIVRQYLTLRENSSLYEEMRQVATTDSLTKVYNRHFFNEILPIRMVQARQRRQPLSVLLVDVNDFKIYNDTYGHLKGDAALKTVARLLVHNLRPADQTARFGGDEFVVILPNTDRNGAEAVARRVRQAFADLSGSDQPVGVSIGAAELTGEQTPEQLLEEADRDLYREKSDRRRASPAA